MKKHKIRIVLLSCALALCMLTSCNVTPTTTPSAETTTQQPTQAPTQEAPSESSIPVITPEPVHNHEYGQWQIITPATCQVEGVQQRSCSCGEVETMTVAKTEHDPVVDKAVNATCLKTGFTEGQHCSMCNTVLLEQRVIPKKSHVEVADAAVESTCSKTGLTEGKHCSECGTVTVKQLESPLKAHNYTDDDDTVCNICGYERQCKHNKTETIKGSDATCQHTGLTDGIKCSHCSEILTAQQIIPIKPHTEVKDAAVKATCTQAGLTEGKHCSVCSTVLVEQKPVDTIPHTEVIDEAVESTYEKTGLTEGKHCSVCNTVLVAQKVTEKLKPILHQIGYYDEKHMNRPNYVTYKEHEGVDVLPTPDAVEGWQFNGWYERERPNEYIIFIPRGSKKDYILYADWSKIQYDIEYAEAYQHTNPAKYDVETSVELAAPFRSGMKFVCWKDDKGNVVTKIPKGTTGKIKLTAQWTSYRNTVISSDNTFFEGVYDKANERYYFIYELGIIENVVLDQYLTTYNKTTTSNHTMKLTNTVSISENLAKTIAKTSGTAVTQSKGWSQTTESSNMASVGLDIEITLGAEAGIEGVCKATFEEKFGISYSESMSFAKSNVSSGSMDSSESMSSSLSYETELSTGSSMTTEVTQEIPGSMPNGYYAYVHAGNVRVFAIVTYDLKKQKYDIDTYNVVDNMHDMLMYYATVQEMNKNAIQGEFDMDIPDLAIQAYIDGSYYVQYDGNGGQGSMPVSLHEVGKDTKLSKNAFTKKGYTFAGWELTTESGVKVYGDESIVKDMAAKGKTVVLRAKWDANPYTLKFNGNTPSGASGSVTGLSGDIKCAYDKQIILPNAPSLTGWTFGGWYKNAACTDDQKLGNAGAKLINLTADRNKTITVYAKWTANVYTVTYDANGGTVGVSSEIKTYDSVYGTLPTPTRKNFTFVGWYNGSVQVSAATAVNTAGNHTLTAHWTPNTTGAWDSGSRTKTITTSGWTEYWDAGLDREALKAQGYTKVQIKCVINGKFDSGDWFKADWYFDVYDRWDGGIHQEKHGNFDTSWERREYTFTVSIDAIRDDGTIKIRYDHEGDGADDWILGTVVINTTAQK